MASVLAFLHFDHGTLAWSGVHASGDPAVEWAFVVDVAGPFFLTDDCPVRLATVQPGLRGLRRILDLSPGELVLAAKTGCYGFRLVDESPVGKKAWDLWRAGRGNREPIAKYLRRGPGPGGNAR